MILDPDRRQSTWTKRVFRTVVVSKIIDHLRSPRAREIGGRIEVEVDPECVVPARRQRKRTQTVRKDDNDLNSWMASKKANRYVSNPTA